MEKPVHKPVLVRESIEGLQVRRDGWYIDCTIGTGGHAEAILERCVPGGHLLGIDADLEAIRTVAERLKHYDGSLILVQDNFRYLEDICNRFGSRPVHGILFDLGMSTLQLEDRNRGFSFQYDAPLDMRFSPEQELTAADIVNTFPEEALAEVLQRYGEERMGRQIARQIVQSRPIRSTGELVRVVERVIRVRHKIHAATRTFQALRIAVNKELESLELALKQAVHILDLGGRLVVISFHSLEDRLVKGFLRREAQGCLCPPGTAVCVCGHSPMLKLITKKVIRPSADEVRANPRSRSARLRVAERIAPGVEIETGN